MLPSLMLLAAIAATPAAAPVTAPADTPLLAAVTAFNNARARFDPAALDALLTPDYVEVSPLGEVDRRPAVLAFYAPDKRAPAPAMTAAVDEVRRWGDVATVIGSISYAVPDASGAPVSRSVRVTYVERRVGGRWLMASAHYTGIRAPR